MNVYVLALSYDIEFNDSDEGLSYAGQGTKIIGVYAKEKDAKSIAAEINPMLSKSKGVDTKNSIIKEKIDRLVDHMYGGSEFVLVVMPFEVSMEEESTMIQTLTTEQCIHLLLQDKDASWSYKGAEALVKSLESEDIEGEEQEFCPNEIRANWSEYSSALECMEDCCHEDDIPTDKEEREEKAISFLDRKTHVIQFDGGIVVAAW